MHARFDDDDVHGGHFVPAAGFGAGLCCADAGFLIWQVYLPSYLQRMVCAMAEERAEFVKLAYFLEFNAVTDSVRHFGACDADDSVLVHQRWSDAAAADPRNCTHANKWGYGFSYVYTAALVRRVPWPAIDFGEDYELVMAAKKHSMKCLAFADAVGSAVVCHITHRANTSQVLNLTHVLEGPHALHCDSTRGSPEEYSFRRRFDAIFGGAPCRALVEPAIAYLAKLPPPAPPPAADEPAPDGDAESAEPSEAEARVELAANGYGHHSYNSLNDF